jgi:DNA-directed RNA polymerase alpha subunit
MGYEMFELGPDLPDDTLVEMVRMPTRIRNAANFAELRTIGDLRETTDETFASIPNLGPGSVKWLRAHLLRPDHRTGMKAKGKFQ